MADDIKLAASAIGLDTCIAKARQTWMDKQPGPRPFVHGDDIITNPHYDPLDPLGRQQDPGAKPVPDFEPECHKRVAASYPIYFSAEWKWFIARKGTGSRTIDSTFQLPFSDVDFNLELRAFDANTPGKLTNIDIWRTAAEALFDNIDIQLNTSTFSDGVDPKAIDRLKVGNFRTDTIVFYRITGK